MNTPTNTQPAPRPFFETLRELRNGATLDELSEKLHELVTAVKESGKSGSLALKITIRPAARNDATTVMIDDEVVIKKPTPDRSTTIMFTTDEGYLSRKDPRQREFDLREVKRDESTELREVRTANQ